MLCKTSNPGSKDLLNLPLKSSSSSAADNDDERLYERIAKLVGGEWSLLAAAASEQQQDDEKAKASNIMSDSAAANAALVPPPRQRPLLGLVVGATDLDALSRARQAAGDEVWILAPGVGAQGGDLRHACRAGMNKAATGLLIPVSRGISTAADPAGAAREFCAQIQAVRAEILAITATAASGASAATDSEAAAASSMIRPYQKDFLDFSLQQGVLNFGSFVLKSGRTSPYFFNAGLFASGAALYKLGKAYASTIMASNELYVSFSLLLHSLCRMLCCCFFSSEKEGLMNIPLGPCY